MSKLSSVKMESIEFAKKHFNGSNLDEDYVGVADVDVEDAYDDMTGPLRDPMVDAYENNTLV